MPDVKISQLPAGTANANAVVPATNAAGTTTQKVTMGAIAALGGGPPAAHKATHATGGTDALTASDIGAAAASHTHPISDVTGLQTALDGKQASGAYAAASHGHDAATTFAAGFLSAADKSKLDGIASGATANATDAQLRDRSTHTGTQTAATISNFSTAAASAAPVQSVASRTGAVTLDHRDISNLPTTLSQFTASQNDLNIGTGGIVRISSNAAVNITGIVAATSGDARLLSNVGSFTITLKHQDTGSAAANRIIGVNSADVEIPANGSAVVYYDGTDSRWRAG